jgi:uncharacterized protein YdiU (UPF0061 family)
MVDERGLSLTVCEDMSNVKCWRALEETCATEIFVCRMTTMFMRIAEFQVSCVEQKIGDLRKRRVT